MELKKFQLNNIVRGSNVWLAQEIEPGQYKAIEQWNNLKTNPFLYHFVEDTETYLLRVRKHGYLSYERKILVRDFSDDIIIHVRQKSDLIYGAPLIFT